MMEEAEQNHPEITRVHVFTNARRAIGALYRHRKMGLYAECWDCLHAPRWVGWISTGGAASPEEEFAHHRVRTHGGR